MESIIKFEMGGKLNMSGIKNAALRKETQNLEQIQMDACKLYDGTRAALDKLNYERSKVLARIQQTKLYTKDGFKNMSEYAESIGLNVSKSAISQMSTAGTVYNDKNAPADLAALPYSTLGAMGSLLNDKELRAQVYKDAENGMFVDGMTQEQAKSYVTAIKATSAPAKVVKTYIAKRNGSLLVGEDKKPFHWTLEEYKECIKADAEQNDAEVVSIKGNRFVQVYADHADLIVLEEDKPQSNGNVKDNSAALMQIVIRKLMRGETLTAKEQEIADKLNAD